MANNSSTNAKKPQVIVTTGFTRKRHPYQITSYVIFFGDVVIFYLFLVPLLHNLEKIIACVIFFILAVLTVYYALYCTKIDPTDQNVTNHRKALAQGQTFDPVDKNCYCAYCKVYVHDSSRHCRACDRCVENFDHHCKWVNNCVGKANYKQFVKMIVSVFLFSATYIAFMVIATVNYAQNRLASVENTYSNQLSVTTGLLAVVWLFTIPTFILMILDFNLIAFHVYLMKIKMTTFDYICKIQEKKEEEEETKEQAKQEKIKAKEEHQQRAEGPKAERTCFDFVLCLNKKRRIRKRAAPEHQSSQGETRDLADKTFSHLAPDDAKVTRAALDKTNTNREIEDEAGVVNTIKCALNEHQDKEAVHRREVSVEIEDIYMVTEVHANPVILNKDLSVRIEHLEWEVNQIAFKAGPQEMGEYALKGDVHWHKHYFGKIRNNNILRTDDIEGASSRFKIYDKSQLREKIFSKQNLVSQSTNDLKRDREKAFVNPITHGVFHEYQGKRPAAVHMSIQSHAYEQPALRYDMPPTGARIRNPMFSDFAYGGAPYGSPTELKGYGVNVNVADSLDSFQRQYDSKRNYGGGPQQYQPKQQYDQGYDQQYNPGYGQQYHQGYDQQYNQAYDQQYHQGYGQQQPQYQDNFQSQKNLPNDKKLESSVHNFYGIDPPQSTKNVPQLDPKAANFHESASQFYGHVEEPKKDPNSFQKNYENFFRGFTPTQATRKEKPKFIEHLNNPKNPLTKKEIYTYDPIKGGPHLKYQTSAKSITHKASDPINHPIKEKWALNENAAKFF